MSDEQQRLAAISNPDFWRLAKPIILASPARRR